MLSQEHITGHAATAIDEGGMLTMLVPALTILAVVLCGLFAAMRVKNKAPAFVTVALLAASFVAVLMTYLNLGVEKTWIAHGFDWINFSWSGSENRKLTTHALIANFSFYLDGLTILWMLFVTGLGTLIALYASEYMSHDVGAGYCRFFAAFSLFVFSMACLVMADNFLLLYLGWEGVGLCSYLLIGYFYKKPSAVAAAKKAFIVNRIGDLFLALGIMLIYTHFGSLEYTTVFAQTETYIEALKEGNLEVIPATVQLIPLLLMGGAFGKSAQLPLYVWLPDAMEGPTPVSALIHAATMVTAGVFLVARTYPLFLLSEHALPAVAWIGALTAFFSATIGMAQFDIKRIMAYSTVSQLGYMFCGLGVLTSVGGAFHVFTHAFFKAMLFLACGAVMHGFAGQLDLRKLSGVGFMRGWKVTTVAMLVGCLNLAGFPIITSGYWSKDMILGEAFANPHTQAIGWILLLTAGLTAYYTFRVFFRVFVGPVQYEMGDEHHGAHEDAHGHGEATHAPAHATHATPHAPGWAINTVLAVLAISAFAIIPFTYSHGGWVHTMIEGSTARYEGAAAYLGHGEHAHGTFLGFEAHGALMVVSGIVGAIGIVIAWWLHYAGRTTAATSRADALLPKLGPIPRWAQHKWYVDEFYDFLIVRPLWVLSNIFHFIDQYIVDGIVDLFGAAPSLTGKAVRPSQSGELHSYAAWMAGGMAVLILIVILVAT
ncbi:NADH-quinone oxidoreductase subunit L [Phycisphaerales bacterium]|nr:NADH-quinone oxidoreductase subunit L [Phycisphaerales bacterium]